MSSIDQILLLQKKVNTAVEKIKQMNDLVSRLKSENDALRRKCAELTNSLEDKTELVSSMEAEQIQIEESIKRALDQLDEVENSVLAAGVTNAAVSENTASVQNAEASQEVSHEETVEPDNQETPPYSGQQETSVPEEKTVVDEVPVGQGRASLAAVLSNFTPAEKQNPAKTNADANSNGNSIPNPVQTQPVNANLDPLAASFNTPSESEPVSTSTYSENTSEQSTDENSEEAESGESGAQFDIF